MKYLAEYCINKLGETNCTIIALLLYIVIWLILLNLPHYVKYIDEKVSENTMRKIQLVKIICFTSIGFIIWFCIEALFLYI